MADSVTEDPAGPSSSTYKKPPADGHVIKVQPLKRSEMQVCYLIFLQLDNCSTRSFVFTWYLPHSHHMLKTLGRWKLLMVFTALAFKLSVFVSGSVVLFLAARSQTLSETFNKALSGSFLDSDSSTSPWTPVWCKSMFAQRA